MCSLYGFKVQQRTINVQYLMCNECAVKEQPPYSIDSIKDMSKTSCGYCFCLLLSFTKEPLPKRGSGRCHRWLGGFLLVSQHFSETHSP